MTRPLFNTTTQLNFRNKGRVLPNTFNDQYYGIAMPPGADYRNEMNRIILDYIAGDEWEELTDRFLGD